MKKGGILSTFIIVSFIFIAITLATFNVSASTPGQISSCQILNTAGTYTLTGNIKTSATCFDIRTSNVIINGNGFSITGNSNGTGIVSSGISSTTLTIKNIIINNFTLGISATATTIHHIDIINSVIVGNGNRVPATTGITGGIYAGNFSIVNSNITNNGNFAPINNSAGISTGGIIATGQNNKIINSSITNNGNFAALTGANIFAGGFIQHNPANQNTQIINTTITNNGNFAPISGSFIYVGGIVMMQTAIGYPNKMQVINSIITNNNGNPSSISIGNPLLGDVSLFQSSIYIINSSFRSLAFDESLLYFANQYGNVKPNYLVSVNDSDISNRLRISQNSAFISSDFTNDINITLFNMPATFVSPIILKDGANCPAGSCKNYTSLNAGTVILSVTQHGSSGGGTYSIGEKSLPNNPPIVTFTNPTPASESTIPITSGSKASIIINSSVSDDTGVMPNSCLLTLNNNDYAMNQIVIDEKHSTCSWQGQLSGGSYTATVSANDSSKLKGTASTQFIVGNGINPNIILLEPVAPTPQNGQQIFSENGQKNIIFNYTIFHAANLQSCVINLNGEDHEMEKSNAIDIGRGYFSTQCTYSSTLDAGNYSFNAKATDISGNVNISSLIAFAISIDTSPHLGPSYWYFSNGLQTNPETIGCVNNKYMLRTAAYNIPSGDPVKFEIYSGTTSIRTGTTDALEGAVTNLGGAVTYWNITDSDISAAGNKDLTNYSFIASWNGLTAASGNLTVQNAECAEGIDGVTLPAILPFFGWIEFLAAIIILTIIYSVLIHFRKVK